jgi:hypothetical protein
MNDFNWPEDEIRDADETWDGMSGHDTNSIAVIATMVGTLQWSMPAIIQAIRYLKAENDRLATIVKAAGLGANKGEQA